MTTKYYTVNGILLYESTAGVRTEYVHDALGSVIATTDSTRKVQNTYRWAGYGTQIARTGTASDPKFLWNGTSGYRTTGRAHSGHYVRRRHYGLLMSAWTTVDPYWLAEAAYVYARARPVSVTDVTGQITVSRHPYKPKKPEHCNGAASVDWKFGFGSDTPTGWLVQQITYFIVEICCGVGHPVDPGGCTTFYPVYIPTPFGSILIAYEAVFYEAWWVKEGKVYSPLGPQCLNLTADDPNYDDHWEVGGISCRHGSVLMTGAVAFIDSNDSATFPGGLTCGFVDCSHGLPSNTTFDQPRPPILFNQAPANSSYSYQCCQGEDEPCKTCPKDQSAGCLNPAKFDWNPK